MTPLIDVVFLLIVFFVLVSRIVDEDRPRLDLPSPWPAATLSPPPGLRATVSIVGHECSGWRYRMSGIDVAATQEGLKSIQSHIKGLLARDENTAVQIRAGQATPWSSVSPVLEAARNAARDVGLHPVRVQLATTRPHLT